MKKEINIINKTIFEREEYRTGIVWQIVGVLGPVYDFQDFCILMDGYRSLFYVKNCDLWKRWYWKVHSDQ